MRGQLNPQSSMFHYFSPESRVPADHPLRGVKQLAERALGAISAELDALYSNVGRPSIPPERLLKGQLLIALYSIRSDRQFCEQLDYNILFRWFLDMGLESASLDQSNFSRLRERLVATDVARRFFDEVVSLARRERLLSSDHFTVDGTLIDAWASFKSFKRKDGEPPKDGGDGTGMVDFKGEKRSNATHQSSTDPDSRLMRKGNGQPAKLSYGGHVLMENRNGLCVDILVTESTQAEHRAARSMLTRARRRHIHPKTLAADKGYHVKDFVAHLREHGVRPHIARIDKRNTPGLDGRTTRTEGYRISQRKRKRVEEIFGWLKTVGGLRKTRFIGQPGEDADGGVHFRSGIQPSQNCEIEQFGGGGMKRTQKWVVAAYADTRFGKSKRIENRYFAVKSPWSSITTSWLVRNRVVFCIALLGLIVVTLRTTACSDGLNLVAMSPVAGSTGDDRAERKWAPRGAHFIGGTASVGRLFIQERQQSEDIPTFYTKH